MLPVEYPKQDFRTKQMGDKLMIFDEFRKKWVVLTPEEWVRQNFLNYLTEVKKYPPNSIAIEKEFRLYDVYKRFDILVYKQQLPWILIECKSESEVLNEKVFLQVVRYGIKMLAPFIVITNGQSSLGWKRSQKLWEEIYDLPAYSD